MEIAISAQYPLNRAEDHHMVIRTQLVDKKSSPEVSTYLADYLNRDTLQYLTETNMKASGKWASETEILATAFICKTGIMVFVRFGRDSCKWLNYRSDIRSNQKSDDFALYLENVSGNHFQPVLSTK